MVINWISGNYAHGLVSVIMPTYNRENLIGEAITSIIDQAYRPIECIVVDDGSKDNTKQVVESFRQKNHQNISIKYLYQNNSGAQVARNNGTLASKGEFIQYLDSDDLLYPDKIEKQVNFLKNNPDVDGVFGNWHKGKPNEKEYFKAYESDDLLTQFLGKFCIANFSFLMRREIVSKIGDWDVNIKRNQEIDYHLRGLINGGKFKYQNVDCGLWRTHNNERIASITGLKEVITFYEKWEQLFLSKRLMNRKIGEQISNNYIWRVLSGSKDSMTIRIEAIRHAIRLNPNLQYFGTPKMKLLRSILGDANAIRIWLQKYDRSKKLH